MKAYCLLNHQLTLNQISELKNTYNVETVIYPNEELSKRWSQIPTVKEIDMSIIEEVCNFLKNAEKNDVLIIQGEFGSTFMIVDYALKHQLIPLHAVSKRIAKEEREGEKVKREYIFEHVCFRQYKYFLDN